MSAMDARSAKLEVGAVAFVPVAASHARSSRRPVNLSHVPLVDTLLRELAQPLTDLSRRIRRIGPVDGGAIVLLTGYRRGVGCSTVAAALAGAAAAERPVLLIDGDLHQAGVSSLLGTSAPFGWRQGIEGHCSPEQPLQRVDPEGRLWLLPFREPVGDAPALLKHPAVPGWLARWRHNYSLIVIDGGPVAETGTLWAPLADGILLVCDAGAGRGPEDRWAHAWDDLEAEGGAVLGIVETLIERRSITG
jgi:Mrp family chromosome partitioning ATPase